LDGQRASLSTVDVRPWVIPFGRPVFGEPEIEAVNDAIRAQDIATGRLVQSFEDRFAAEFGYAHCVATTSGSTANLLALAALVERGDLRPGDRVVVSGATFISAVSPVVQLGMTPVFVDIGRQHVNVDLDLVDDAVATHGARAVLLPHALGQPLDLQRIGAIRRERGVAVVEDCCESLGAADPTGPVGSVGDIATHSFYAGHHITTGEGGMLGCPDAATATLLRSLRAFGRDLGYDGARLDYPVADRRIAPDERYVHLRLGYNGKLTDMQAAFGLVQLTRHTGLAAERLATARILRAVVHETGSWHVLGNPHETGCAPFGLALLPPPRVSLSDAAASLREQGIDSRGFLGASLPAQPCFDGVPHIVHEPYRWAAEYAQRVLIIGCPPGLDLAAAAAALRKALVNVP
jgi:CDP-6-deoxy-D-xylo-4-hexulose-3-dehydrase